MNLHKNYKNFSFTKFLRKSLESTVLGQIWRIQIRSKIQFFEMPNHLYETALSQPNEFQKL